MIATLGIAGAVTATLHGFGQAGIAAMAAGTRPDPSILRPPALKGRVLQIDPATALAASAAARLRACLQDVAPPRVGVIVASRIGNYQMLREFAKKVRRGSQSPVQFSASGYNVCAGLAALAAGVNGPTLALAGRSAAIGDALAVAAFGMLRGDADAAIVGTVATDPDGSLGGCGFLALTRAILPGHAALCIGVDGSASSERLPVPDLPLLTRLPELASAFALAAALEDDRVIVPRRFTLVQGVIAREFEILGPGRRSTA
jgi:hypothetical protein